MNFNTLLKDLVASSMMVAGLGTVMHPTQAASSEQYHIVARGETLSQIAQFYRIDWRELADYNNLTDPNLIYPGQKLSLTPQADSSSQSTTSIVPAIEFLSVNSIYPLTLKYEGDLLWKQRLG